MPKTRNRINESNEKNKQVDFVLLITVLLLLSLGIIMVLSASSPSSLAKEGSSYEYVTKQLFSAIIGIAAMVFFSRVDYKIYQVFYKKIYIISVVVLLLVLTPIGISANGALRWINVGFSTLQPSEITKLGLIIFYAGLLSSRKDKLNKLSTGFFMPILFLIPVMAILIIVQDHLSATFVIVIITAILMLMAGSRLRYFLSFGLAGVGLVGAGLYYMAIVSEKGAFRLKRIISFMDPWADLQGDGWQVIQGLYAIGSGGLFGAGLGNSNQKYLYIPEPHNDFIFAVLAEELGFVGCLAVISLFAIFILRGAIIAMKSKDMFGSLLAIGITSLVGIQAIINIAVVTSSMPNTGMPLPFFSYGGTALIILLSAVGILLNISRHMEKV